MRDWVYDAQDLAMAWLPAGIRMFLAVLLGLAAHSTPEPWKTVVLIAAVAVLVLRPTKTRKSKGE